MRNAGLEEAQAGVKTARRNINNLRYADQVHESRQIGSGQTRDGKSEHQNSRGMVWGGRREEGSGWGTQVYLWRIHFDICKTNTIL